jgi:hypothetical protein
VGTQRVIPRINYGERHEERDECQRSYEDLCNHEPAFPFMSPRDATLTLETALSFGASGGSGDLNFGGDDIAGDLLKFGCCLL